MLKCLCIESLGMFPRRVPTDRTHNLSSRNDSVSERSGAIGPSEHKYLEFFSLFQRVLSG